MYTLGHKWAYASTVIIMGALMSCSGPSPVQPPQLRLPVDSSRWAGMTSHRLEVRSLSECSGLTASARFPGLFYGANDSGNAPELFVLDSQARLVCRLQMPTSVRNHDWEALTLDGHRGYLYIGDVGDNQAHRPYITIYRLREPDTLASWGARQLVTTVDSIHLHYPNGARDAEALFVHEPSGQLYILTKRERNVGVFRVPMQFDGHLHQLMQAGTMPLYKTTDASLQADGRQLLVSTYHDVFLWTAAASPSAQIPSPQGYPGDSSGTWTRLPWPREKQTEAIAWHRNGRAFSSLSERGRDTLPHLRHYRLR